MAVESWDLDDDFQGDFQTFGNASVGTGPLSMSSRMSTRSESVAGDEDWNVVITPNDEHSTTQAIQSAKQAGIPLPNNVPASALLGGTIKRLGKKKSKQKIDHDWDNDLEMSDQPLQLKPRADDPGVMSDEGFDDFDDELEGSLGIRFAGKRDTRNRSGSASVMSPSLGSATADSEVDDLGGLDFPEGPMDFDALLKKRRAADAELSDLSQPSSAVVEQEPTMTKTHKKSKLESDDNDDFFGDLDLGDGEVLNVRKRTTNRNVQVKSARVPPAAQRAATTLNFHDRATDKPIYTRSHIPRPVSGTRHTSRLDPVFESGDMQGLKNRRGPTTTSAQLLRSKRSMPALRNQSSHGSLSKPSVPFLPAGVSNMQSPHITTHRAMPYHLRRDSDPNRPGAQSPPPQRPSSRLSNQITPDTPSRVARHRENVAPASLVRQAAAKHTLTKPIKKRHFGDGNELEIFDDLPTSVTTESKFMKQPVGRGPPKQSTLRATQSRSDLTDASKRNSAITIVPDRMMTPAPRTPASPTKGFYDAPTATPSYLRDTAASRIARETRLANQPRPRSEGPLQPLTTNWKAQVAARSPFSSPGAQRQKSIRRPGLIAGIGSHVAKSEKGMIYNPQTLRWEGNENTLQAFDMAPLETPTPQLRPRSSYIGLTHQRSNTSPSRPALISHVPTGSGFNIQVQNGMVYDPQQMKWLKVKGGRDVSNQLSSSATDVEDEEDAFAGIDDLKDENVPAGGQGIDGMNLAAPPAENFHEEFDIGLRFIDLQRTEEEAWRRICSNWFVGDQPRPDNGMWRHSIRDIVPADGF